MKMAKRLIYGFICLIFLLINFACPPPDNNNPDGEPTPVPTEGQPTPVTSNQQTNPPTTAPTPVVTPAPGEAHPPLAVKYIYRDGELNGNRGVVVITRAADETDVAFYNLYWGTEPGTKYSQTAFAQIAKTVADTKPQAAVSAGTTIPANVKFVLAYAENSAGEETDISVAYEISPRIALKLIDFNPGPAASNPAEMCEFNGKLYFAADRTDSGRELGYYEASTNTADRPAGADLMPGASADSNPRYLTTMPGTYNKLYFQAADPAKGVELWTLDTSDTFTCISDINPDSGDSFPGEMTFMPGEGAADNLIYFYATNAAAETELYACDINGNITNINDSSLVDAEFHTPHDLVMYGSTLYFAATGDPATYPVANPDTTVAAEMNIYTLPEAGEVALLIGAQTVAPKYLTMVDDLLYYQSNFLFGREIWSYNISSSTFTPFDIIVGSEGSDPCELSASPLNDTLYFSATAAGIGRELRINGIGYVDINPGAASSNPADITVFGEYVFCQATGADGEQELYLYIPGDNNFYQLDLNLAGSSTPENLIVYQNALYFAADTGDGLGKELCAISILP